MKESKYYPLMAIEKISKGASNEEEFREMEEIFETFTKPHYHVDKSMTVNDFYNFVFSHNFFSKDYKGPFEEFNHKMLEDKDANSFIMQLYSGNLSMKDYEQRAIEWKDIYAQPYIIHTWEKYKIAYKIDNEFFHEIRDTENVVISSEMFDALPYKCFFIDLTEVKGISNTRGAFIYIVKSEDKIIGLNTIFMKNDMEPIMFSNYQWLNFRESEVLIYDYYKEGEEESVSIRCFGDMTKNDKNNKIYTVDYWDEKFEDNNSFSIINFVVMQLIQFIALDASDVEENPITKKTYRKSDKIRNKFSEVRMFDVGVRYGRAIKVARDRFEREKSIIREKSENNNENNGYRKERKPTIPHIRRAHWHTYRIGKGRKETIVRWVAPIFVLCNGDTIPVTIHEIVKEA